MSTLIVDTSKLSKRGFPHRISLRVWNWLKREYRLTTHARVRSKAENGDPKCQFILAEMCESGNGTAKCLIEALKWYQKAAYQGVAQAQLALGLKYLIGQGVAANDSEAVLWLRKAAEQGQAEAQYHLANLYREGKGTAKDLVQAAKWCRKAAERGYALADLSLNELIPCNIAIHAPEESPSNGHLLADRTA